MSQTSLWILEHSFFLHYQLCRSQVSNFICLCFSFELLSLSSFISYSPLVFHSFFSLELFYNSMGKHILVFMGLFVCAWILHSQNFLSLKLLASEGKQTPSKGPIFLEKYWYYFHCPKNVLHFILSFVFLIFSALGHCSAAVRVTQHNFKISFLG